MTKFNVRTKISTVPSEAIEADKFLIDEHGHLTLTVVVEGKASDRRIASYAPGMWLSVIEDRSS